MVGPRTRTTTRDLTPPTPSPTSGRGEPCARCSPRVRRDHVARHSAAARAAGHAAGRRAATTPTPAASSRELPRAARSRAAGTTTRDAFRLDAARRDREIARLRRDIACRSRR